MRQKLIQGILIGSASALLSLALFFSGSLDWVENATWDWRVRQHAKPSEQSNNIKLIFLDQASLDWGTAEQGWQWPWPRVVYSAVLDFCKRGGAKSVAFDILYTEASPYGVEDDNALGAAAANLGTFVQAVQLTRKQGATTEWPSKIPSPGIKVDGLNKYLRTAAGENHKMPTATFPIEEIGSKATVLGDVAGNMQKDAIIRRATSFSMFDDRFVPSLALATYLAANPDTKLHIEDHTLYVGDLRIPLDSNGRTVINYRGESKTHEAFHISSIINSELRINEGKEPEIDPSALKDAHVLVGMTAAGLRDLRPTPISKEFPGVEIHATILDNLLSDDFIKEAPFTTVLICTILFALIASISGRACTNWQLAVLAFIILLPLPLTAGYLAYSSNIWLPVAPAIVAVIFSLISALVLNYAAEGKQRRFIKNAFKQYLSPVVIDKLVRDPSHLKLGGEKRELSIYFSDVQGFTTISEALEPEELTTLLNDYLSAMTSIIHEQGGTIDKYEGDAIIAFWNAPLDNVEHAKNSVRAALLGQEKLAELRPEFKERTGKAILARIGINTGLVVVGNMGSKQRFDYTFLGDAGNLAARLEGINKMFGTFLLISEFTVDQLDDEFTCRELSRVQVVGKKNAVRVYEPYFTDKADTKLIASFDVARDLYYDGNFSEALTAFEKLADSDPVSAKYVPRCQQLIDNPPENWDGVWAATEK